MPLYLLNVASGFGTRCRHWAGPVLENIVQLCQLHAVGEVWHGEVDCTAPPFDEGCGNVIADLSS